MIRSSKTGAKKKLHAMKAIHVHPKHGAPKRHRKHP
jgi:hypothetical protein